MADTDEMLDEVFRLRYQVYCVEKGFLSGEGGRETDDFDSVARHVLLIHRPTGQSVGTVRVVPPSGTLGLSGVPMTRLCPLSQMRSLPNFTTGEISRFAVSKSRRVSCRAGAMFRLGLMQGIVRASTELGLTHWCAIMEPILRRLLQSDGIHFDLLGDPVEYCGLRLPLGGDIDTVLAGIHAERPDVWNYITLGGTLWRSKALETVDA